MKIQNIETGEEFDITGSVNVLHVVDEVEEVWVHYTYINDDGETMTLEMPPNSSEKYSIIY